uniref:Uncharacterized protein n=1 Tax=Schistosoma haematobium TaxID=6185 RepID=A0A095A0U5_SCHHA
MKKNNEKFQMFQQIKIIYIARNHSYQITIMFLTACFGEFKKYFTTCMPSHMFLRLLSNPNFVFPAVAINDVVNVLIQNLDYFLGPFIP